MYEQLSLFDTARPTHRTAIPCWEYGQHTRAEPIEDWMKKLVPEGEFFCKVGQHTLVLRPADHKAEHIPTGHQFFHYTIGTALYTGVFVERDDPARLGATQKGTGKVGAT